MIACFYFWYHFISEVLLWVFHFAGQTCVALHCGNLSESLRHVLLFYSLFLMCQARLGSSLRGLQLVSRKVSELHKRTGWCSQRKKKSKKPFQPPSKRKRIIPSVFVFQDFFWPRFIKQSLSFLYLTYFVSFTVVEEENF